LKIITLQEDLVSDIVELRYEINERCLRNGREPIFKATSTTEIAVNILGEPIHNQEDFRRFVSFLYQYIYESAGGSNLIIPSTLLQDSIILDIKFLRNSFEHDLEHGLNREILKKHQRVGQIYEKYTGKDYIKADKDWGQMQISFLQALRLYLEKILEVIA